MPKPLTTSKLRTMVREKLAGKDIPDGARAHVFQWSEVTAMVRCTDEEFQAEITKHARIFSRASDMERRGWGIDLLETLREGPVMDYPAGTFTAPEITRAMLFVHFAAEMPPDGGAREIYSFNLTGCPGNPDISGCVELVTPVVLWKGK